MEASCKKILLKPRELLSPLDNWPPPKSHQYYQLHLFSFPPKDQDNKTRYLNALDVARQRRDIDYLVFNLYDLRYDAVWSKMEELLNLNDRTWLVCVDCANHDKLEDLTRALEVLRNLTYLKLDRLNFNDTSGFQCLDHLPPFFKLQSLHVPDVEQGVTSIGRLVSYPFTPKLCQIRPCRKLGSFVSGPEESRKRIHSLQVDFDDLSVESAVNAVTVVQDMPCLHQLCVTMPHFMAVHEYRPLLATLFQWLGNPQCPVQDLTFNVSYPECLPDILAVLPKTPLLKSLWLQNSFDIRNMRHYWKNFFPSLWASPHLKSITLHGWDKRDFSRQDLLEFQLSSRPRLVSIQLVTDWGQAGTSFGPDSHPDTKNVHFVSVIFQLLRKFRHSKNQPTFPLSAWTVVLEKLGTDTFDEPLAKVVAVGMDAQFSIIRELFETPHQLV